MASNSIYAENWLYILKINCALNYTSYNTLYNLYGWYENKTHSTFKEYRPKQHNTPNPNSPVLFMHLKASQLAATGPYI